MILHDDGKKDFLESNFHQYFDINLSTEINPDQVIQHANITLPLSKINEIYDLTAMAKFFNDNYNNVIFTSPNNNVIHRYEFYQGVYFIRMDPFESVLRMHLIPKKYDASDSATNYSILFFKDKKQNIDDNIFSHSSLYERNDEPIINTQYLATTRQTANAQYKFDIKEYTKNLQNLQLNMGYSYNDTTPTAHRQHYTGIIDESDENGNPVAPGEFTEFNEALMDANYDSLSSYTNVSKQQKYSANGITWPSEYTPYSDGNNSTVGFNNTHSLNTVYHKIIKYYNDDIYIEENGEYLMQLWKEGRWYE